jgi:hypothetical protein
LDYAPLFEDKINTVRFRAGESDGESKAGMGIRLRGYLMGDSERSMMIIVVAGDTRGLMVLRFKSVATIATWELLLAEGTEKCRGWWRAFPPVDY